MKMFQIMLICLIICSNSSLISVKGNSPITTILNIHIDIIQKEKLPLKLQLKKMLNLINSLIFTTKEKLIKLEKLEKEKEILNKSRLNMNNIMNYFENKVKFYHKFLFTIPSKAIINKIILNIEKSKNYIIRQRTIYLSRYNLMKTRFDEFNKISEKIDRKLKCLMVNYQNLIENKIVNVSKQTLNVIAINEIKSCYFKLSNIIQKELVPLDDTPKLYFRERFFFYLDQANPSLPHKNGMVDGLESSKFLDKLYLEMKSYIYQQFEIFGDFENNKTHFERVQLNLIKMKTQIKKVHLKNFQIMRKNTIILINQNTKLLNILKQLKIHDSCESRYEIENMRTKQYLQNILIEYTEARRDLIEENKEILKCKSNNM